MDILNTLQAINRCHGPSGDEGPIADQIAELAKPYADEITRDTLGNLFVHKKGSGPRVMFAAHMDSIGFIVTHIDEQGFLHFGRVGGLRTHSCLHVPVRFKNGVKGVVGQDCSVETTALTLDDLYIDIGAKDQKEAEAMVKIGDTAVVDLPAAVVGSRLTSPYMDNRISCVVLLMALEKLQSNTNDLWFVFTVQEELGLRGAKPAAYQIDPKYGIAVDVTPAADEYHTKHAGSSVLSGGAAIKVMDGSVICHPHMVQKLDVLAKESSIKSQKDVIKAGGTDAGAIHVSRNGVYTGGISIPCRYVHSPVEMVDCEDVEACADLVAAFACASLE